MESGSLKTRFFRYASATVASLLVFSLYSMVDGFFVANGVGEYAMAAVNLCFPFLNVLFSVCLLFAVGTSTILSICLGQEKKEQAHALFSQNLVVLTVIGLLLGAVVRLFPRQTALLLGAGDQTIRYATDYLCGLAPFAVFFIVSYNLEILVKADGFPRLALISVTAGCLLNCAGDYVTIYLLDLGVWGAAVATGLSQMASCAIFLLHFFGKRSTFRFVRFHFDLSIYRHLLPLGLSDSLSELCSGLLIFLYNRVILWCIGEAGLVYYSIIAYINTLAVNLLMGISEGAQPLISYYHGKKDFAAMGTLRRCSLFSACGVGTVLFAACMLFAAPITDLFLRGEAMQLHESAAHALRCYCPAYLLMGVNICTAGWMTATERPGAALLISLGRGFVFCAAALLLLAVILGGSSIWFAPTVSEAVCLTLSLLLLKKCP